MSSEVKGNQTAQLNESTGVTPHFALLWERKMVRLSQTPIRQEQSDNGLSQVEVHNGLLTLTALGSQVPAFCHSLSGSLCRV